MDDVNCAQAEYHRMPNHLSSDFGSSRHLPGVLIETDTFTAIQTHSEKHIYKEVEDPTRKFMQPNGQNP